MIQGIIGIFLRVNYISTYFVIRCFLFAISGAVFYNVNSA